MLEKREFEKNDFLFRLSMAITVVSGFFSLIVFLLLLINYMQIRAADPVDHEMITKMRQEYAALPLKDEALAKRIQELDLLTRKAFFTTQYHLRVGAALLLTGVCVFLVAFKSMLRWRRETPALAETPTAEVEFLAYAKSRQLITWAGVGLLGIGMLATLLSESALVESTKIAAASPETETTGGEAAPGAAEEAPPSRPVPTWEEMEQNWPSFRGPGSSGTAHFTTAPVAWDMESGSGIKWKSAVPLHGANSPVVWGKHVYVAGADAAQRVIYCFDVDGGELVWERALEPLPGTPAEPPDVSEDTGFAAPSMALHGSQLFAIFANGDLVSFDDEGTQVWGKNVGVPDNHYGHSSSLIAFEGLLYVQLDQSSEGRLQGLDVATGKEVWSVPRQTISWASPIIAQTPYGPELIVNSEETVDAYVPLTGTLSWSQECLGGEVAPSPVYSNGLVFAANEFAVASAIQLTKPADAVEAEVIWEYDEYLPEVSSPIGDGERFYFGTSAGDVVCLDAKTGEELWVEEVSRGFYSSPILVGDRIYIADMEGSVYIVKAASEYELIAEQVIGEPIFATPAFLDGRIYLRTEEFLYCIEEADA